MLELVHTGPPPAAVRTTQRSVGARVTFTCMTLRDCSESVEESKQWAEEEIHHLQEITSPDVFCMMAQECFPGLATGACWASLEHRLLNRPFTHPNIQLEELPPDALCSEDVCSSLSSP